MADAAVENFDAEGGVTARSAGFGHTDNAPAARPAAAVDNTPLRDCVAHRRSLQ